jgi:hypothetical protein
VAGFSFSSGANQTLIEHWNGGGWKRVKSPAPGQGSILLGVAVGSRSSAWAVGDFTSGGRQKSLILRWNGTRWLRVPSPNPGSSNALSAVAATSSTNAWAVGTFNGAIRSALAINCC